MQTVTQSATRVSQASRKGPRDSQQDAMLSLRVIDHVTGIDTLALGVFDGVGGHPDGDLASSIAAETCQRSILTELCCLASDGISRAESLLVDALKRANARVRELGGEHGLPPASTAVVALLRGDELTVAHLGDSPAVLVERDGVTLLTRPHADPFGRLSRCLGVRPNVEPEVSSHTLTPGQRLVLMSDGVSGVLTEDDLVRLSAEGPGGARGGGRAEALVEDAITFGSADNCTAVCAEIETANPSLDDRDETIELLPGAVVSVGGVRLRLESPKAEEATAC